MKTEWSQDPLLCHLLTLLRSASVSVNTTQALLSGLTVHSPMTSKILQETVMEIDPLLLLIKSVSNLENLLLIVKTYFQAPFLICHVRIINPKFLWSPHSKNNMS